MRDGQDGAEGKDVLDALKNFLGTVKYNKSNAAPASEKIKDAHGIEYLRNAELVSLKYNEITDLSWLGREPKDDQDNQRYFGQVRNVAPGLDEDDKNVTWDFSGNSLQKLPPYFGGQLKILQPGGASYTYGEDVSAHMVYVRPADSTAVNGTLDINKCNIYAGGTKAGPIGIKECYVSSRPGDTATKMEIVLNSWTDDLTAQFENLEKSGVFHVYAGTKAEIKYGTNNEYSGITDGSQSTKYYMTASFTVYDRITTESAKGGRAKLAKTNGADGDAIAGAAYGLYHTANDTLISEYTTDSSGEIVTDSLMPGEYYFQETTAPDGYKLNPDKIPFTITEVTTGTLLAVALGGGETSVTDSNGTTVNAAADERLFAGGRKGVGETGDLFSPALTLSSTETVLSVKVTYSKLDTEGGNVVRTFDTLAEAQTDINTEKEANNIIGSVSVKAYFASQAADAAVAVNTQDTAISKTDITVNKVWADYNNALKTRPESVTVALLADGAEIKTMEVRAANDWAFTFNDLPIYTDAGKKITYSVREKDLAADYTASVAGADITNTLDEKMNRIVTVEGKKIWNDSDNASGMRPEKVTISLLQNGTELKRVETDAGQNWGYSFTGLPKYDANGTEYGYAVQESAVPEGYTSTVSGYDITNTKAEGAGETVTVSGKKVWDDYNNALEMRPEKVTISLLQNGTELITAETNAAKGWGYSFAGFAKYDANGKEYVYTVKEGSVPKGYTSKVEGYNITNTLEAANKKDTPKTGDAGSAGGWALLALAAVGITVGIKHKKK